VAAFGRPRDTARLSDGDKVLEIAEIKVQGAFPEVPWGGPSPARKLGACLSIAQTGS
jgi:hypothetical protein